MNPKHQDSRTGNTETRQARPASTGEQDIRIDGIEQVVQMLRHADPHFRASILRRIQARDPALAHRILRAIRGAG
jgi:hypothetical protein